MDIDRLLAKLDKAAKKAEQKEQQHRKNWSAEFLEDFWSKVDVISDVECWWWKGRQSVGGYGIVSAKSGLTEGAHRVSYQLSWGKIPDGLYVCHVCDNPPCVNPLHLWADTTKANVLDMFKKGRARNGDGPTELMEHPDRYERSVGRLVSLPSWLGKYISKEQMDKYISEMRPMVTTYKDE